MESKSSRVHLTAQDKMFIDDTIRSVLNRINHSRIDWAGMNAKLIDYDTVSKMFVKFCKENDYQYMEGRKHFVMHIQQKIGMGEHI